MSYFSVNELFIYLFICVLLSSEPKNYISDWIFKYCKYL